MGRAFGYGRSGLLSEHMTLAKRYTPKMVADFFRKRKDEITLIQAKSILDTLHRSDHYPTERPAGSSDLTLLRRPKKEADNPEEPASEMDCADIGSYLTYQIIHREWSTMTQSKFRIFKRRDKLVREIATAKDNKQPISLEGGQYKLVGHEDKPGRRVKLMFEELTMQEQADFCNPPVILP